LFSNLAWINQLAFFLICGGLNPPRIEFSVMNENRDGGWYVSLTAVTEF
jgi:hypothetical protein